MLGGIGGSALGRVLVEVGLDARPLEAGMAKAKGTAKTGATGIGTTMSTAIKAGAVLAGAAVIKFGADSVRAFEESQRAGEELSNTLENNAKLSDVSTQSWADQSHALQELSGVQDEAITSSQAMLGQFDLTGQQVQELIPLVLDLSQKMGIDLATATKAVGKATDGSTGSLARYGIKIDAGKDGTADFADVVDGLTQKVGGFTKSISGNFSTRMAVLAANFDDVKESVGQALVPILEDLAGILNKMMPLVQFAAENWQILLGAFLAYKAISFLPSLFSSLNFAMNGLGAASTLLGKGVQGAATALQGMSKLSMLGWAAAAAAAIYEVTVAIDALHGDFSKINAFMEVHLGPDWIVLSQEIDTSKQSMDKAKISAQGLSMMHEELATTAVNAATSERDYTAAMRDARLAELSLAGGLVGLEADLLAVKQAQAELTDKTGNHRQEVISLQGAVLTLANDMDAYNHSQGAAAGGSRGAIGALVALGHQFGLTRSDVTSAANEALRYSGILNSIPSNVVTHVTTVYHTVGSPASPGKQLP